MRGILHCLAFAKINISDRHDVTMDPMGGKFPRQGSVSCVNIISIVSFFIIIILIKRFPFRHRRASITVAACLFNTEGYYTGRIIDYGDGRMTSAVPRAGGAIMLIFSKGGQTRTPPPTTCPAVHPRGPASPSRSRSRSPHQPHQ